MKSATGALLWLRALLVGSVTMVLATTAHATGGGRIPGGFAMGFLLLLAVVTSVPLLRVRAGWGRLALLLGGGQFFLHTALTVLAGHRGDGGPAAPTPEVAEGPVAQVVDGRRVGSLFDAYAATLPTPLAPAPGDGSSSGGLVDHASMMLLHLVVAAVVAGWLAHGERCLWTVLALLERRLRLLWAPVAVLRRADQGPPTVRAHGAIPHLVRLAPCVVRRGPPAPVAVHL